jgi:hypothetical protein
VLSALAIKLTNTQKAVMSVLLQYKGSVEGAGRTAPPLQWESQASISKLGHTCIEQLASPHWLPTGFGTGVSAGYRCHSKPRARALCDSH